MLWILEPNQKVPQNLLNLTHQLGTCQIKKLKKGVCHIVALPFYILKVYLKAKEKLWKLRYFTMPKYPKILNIPLKETKILQDIITL